jgi:hypothetical protein
MPAPPVTSNVCPLTKLASGEIKLYRALSANFYHISMADTYNSMAAAASSAVAPRWSGMSGYAVGPDAADLFPAPGTPSAIFLPSISIVAPLSFAAVNLVSLQFHVRTDANQEFHQPCVNQTEGDSVCPNTERTPLLAGGLG